MIEIQTMHCFLVRPSKGEEEPLEIVGTSVPKRGRLYDMLKGIFDNAEEDCPTEIVFTHNANGLQQNDCRDLLLAYLNSQSVADGRQIALRLQGVTTQKSGLGLLFLMVGHNGNERKFVISRFAADQGVSAEEKRDRLTVEFLERVFMKNAKAYKAAVYCGSNCGTDFWTGRAVDKQINLPGDLADYWIRKFLVSELQTTPAAGTMRLATALRSALGSLEDPKAKAQVLAAATLVDGFSGRTLSPEQFCRNMGFGPEATCAVERAMPYPELMKDQFQLDAEEFKAHIAFRSVELDNGAILTASAAKFDNVFHPSQTAHDGQMRFTTEGKVVDQRLRCHRSIQIDPPGVTSK